MDQRLSLVTLGVSDLERSRRFYGAMGWEQHPGSPESVAFFQTGCMVVALWSREELAADSCVQDGGGWGGVTLAMNVRSEEEVRAVLDEARAAGARIGREAAATFWGGYSGVFVDPDGHPWEVALNPAWRVTDEGATLLD